jgi:ADP-ribose pyrophosphatase YjhB (NUDIX family)
LIQRGKGALAGLWSLPGGHVEPGEGLAAAAAREVLEETGVTARIEGRIDTHEVILRDSSGVLTHHYVITVHAARWMSGEPAAASDAAAATFAAVNDLAGVPMTAGAQDLIRRGFEALQEADRARGQPWGVTRRA